jgi:signal transduction histidine kinase
VVRTPLVHRGQRIGDLAIAVPAGRTLSTADHTLLEDLARHAAVTVRAAQLAAELAASRSRIVTAREEERRRLRRDLHDGLGPSLAAVLLKLQAAQSHPDEATRGALIAEIRAETRAAIAEVRRVVDDLRPPAIDEVGLVGAIRQRAAALSSSSLVYRVVGPEDMPPLPAAVEVAAFRVASEAMTNVLKHATASRCNVEVELSGGADGTQDGARTLGLTVADDGRGTSAVHGANGRVDGGAGGVGWTSMVERAAEIGGRCTIARRAEGGLVVRAVLPLHDVRSEAVG